MLPLTNPTRLRPAHFLLTLCLTGLVGCGNSGGGNSNNPASNPQGSSNSSSSTNTTVVPAATGAVVGSVAAPSAGGVQLTLSNVTVSVQGTFISSTLSAGGTFELDNVPPGNQVIAVSNGASEGAAIVAYVAPSSTTVVGQISLATAGLVSGQINRTDSGTPLDLAVVQAVPLAIDTEALTDFPNDRPIFLAYTDTGGNYTLSGLPLGDYFVYASDPGFSAASQIVTVATGSSPVANFGITPMASTSGSVVGNVTSLNGNVPVSNALVYLDASASPATPNLLQRLGGNPVALSGDLSGTTVDATIILPADQLGAQEIAEQLLPSVPPTGSNTTQGRPVFALTDANGHFEIDNVPAGNYTAFYGESGYTVASQTVQIASGPLTVADQQLSSLGGSIAGLVLDPTTHLLPGVGVIADLSGDVFGPVTPVTTDYSAGTASAFAIAVLPPLRYFAVSDTTGNYLIPSVVASSYNVTAFGAGFIDQTQPSSQVTALQSEDISFQMVSTNTTTQVVPAVTLATLFGNLLSGLIPQ